MALNLAQLAWLVASLHEGASPPGDVSASRALAYGTVGVAVTLTLASCRSERFALPAATVSLISTATTAWYAGRLRPGAAITRAGYGAALFSTAAALLLLACGLDRPRHGVLVVAAAPDLAFI
mgnify:CR=1 FL=1